MTLGISGRIARAFLQSKLTPLVAVASLAVARRIGPEVRDGANVDVHELDVGIVADARRAEIGMNLAIGPKATGTQVFHSNRPYLGRRDDPAPRVGALLLGEAQRVP